MFGDDITHFFLNHVSLKKVFRIVAFRYAWRKKNTLHFLPHLPASDNIANEVSTDPECIGKETEAWFQCTTMFPDTQERLLNNVVREIGVMGAELHVTEYDGLIPFEEDPECVDIRVPGSLQELPIAGDGVHDTHKIHGGLDFCKSAMCYPCLRTPLTLAYDHRPARCLVESVGTGLGVRGDSCVNTVGGASWISYAEC